jgi:glutathione synthase/RimK-type ligase-like ATP-grasp enzyme
VFCQDNVDAPSGVVSEAVRAVAVLGLDFGAVDVGWNEYRQQPCVYEVNTAFGMEGQTLSDVAQAMRDSYL